MFAHPLPPPLSVEEYLELEENSTVKHEYLDGYVYAMAGGTVDHGAIAVNVITVLRPRLRGGPCRVYTSDVKVRLGPRRFVYPGRNDTIKACGYIDDLISSMLQLDERNEGVFLYNFCHPQRYTSKDICSAFSKVAGYPLPRLVAPFWLLAGVTIFLISVVSMGVGLLYSIGTEELPSVIGAGVSGPRAK